VKILQLVPRLPFPPSDGGKIGILGIVRGYVRAGHQVRLLGFDTDNSFEAFESELAPLLSGHYVERMPARKTVLSVFNSLVTRRPFLREKYWSRSMARQVVESYVAWQPDFVHIDHSHMGAYGLTLKQRCPGARVYLRAHNVDYVIWERLHAAAANPVSRAFSRDQAAMVRAYERRLFTRLDGVVPLTVVDSERVSHEAPSARIYTMPAGCELQESVRLRDRITDDPRLCFVGLLDWIANRDGIVWFVEQVWPEIRRRWPQARLDVIGRTTNPIRQLSETEGVVYHGFVERLESVLSTSDCAVVPLRIGGGMRIKILDFLSRGIPTISTSVGAEGIPARWGGQEVLKIADAPADFVRVIAELCESASLRAELAERGRNFIAAEYDWAVLMDRFCNWVADQSPTSPC
jgi:polysaccharide biosynthesis protein PslH